MDVWYLAPNSHFLKFVPCVKTVKKLEVSLETDVIVIFETVFLFNPGYSPSR